MNVYFGAPDGAIDMSLLAILLFVGTMALSLWATMLVRQVYGKFSQLPASFWIIRRGDRSDNSSTGGDIRCRDR
jgi:hypothetical protein